MLFAPTGLQPLKLDEPPTPFSVRLELTEAACASDPRFSVSGIDAPHPDATPNYTVDTLAALASLYPHDTLFNLVGADSFLSLRDWRSPERLLDLAEWIVVSRPGYPLTEPDLAPLQLSPRHRARVHLLTGVEEDVSATLLRDRLRQGDPSADLLPPGVAARIAEHHLYR